MSVNLRLSGPVLFLSGVLTGVVLGWVFQGVIGILIRAVIVAAVVAVIVVIYRIWAGSNNASDPLSDITDADWHDLDPRNRT